MLRTSLETFNILITLICHLEQRPYDLKTNEYKYQLDCVEHSNRKVEPGDNLDANSNVNNTTGSAWNENANAHTNGSVPNDKGESSRENHSINERTVSPIDDKSVDIGSETKVGTDSNVTERVLDEKGDAKIAKITQTDLTTDSSSATAVDGIQDVKEPGNAGDGLGETINETSSSSTEQSTSTNKSSTLGPGTDVTPDTTSITSPDPDQTPPPKSIATPNLQPLLMNQFHAKLESSSPNEVKYTCSNATCDANNTMDPLSRLVLLHNLTGVEEILVRNINLEAPYDFGYIECELQEFLTPSSPTQISTSKFFICSIRTRWKQFEYDWKYLFAILFIGAGGVGNILVCLAVCLDKSLQNVTNYFLLSLALADLLVSVLVMPLGAIPGFFGYWPLSVSWCNVYLTSDVLACSCSIMHMCCISLGRYLGIRNPLKTRHTYSTKKLVGIKIFIVWCLSLSVGGSITLLGLYNPNNIMQTGKRCAINNRAFFLFGSLVAFYIPMLIMVISYALTVQLLRKKARFLSNSEKSPGKAADMPTFRTLGGRNNKLRMPQPANLKVDQQTQTPQVIDKFRFPPILVNFRLFKHIKKAQRRTRQASTAANSVRTEQKASKVLGLVFFTFVLCWAPFFLLQILQAICPTGYCTIPEDLGIVCLWLGYFSSILNPIIYTIFNRTFRAAFIRLLKCKCGQVTKPIRYRSVNDRATASSGPATVPLTLPPTPGRTLSVLSMQDVSHTYPTNTKV